ncbi:MAG TPA: response regulator, partial [Stellaceae bacterium]|nr:response regulator [Stellaceae bacterium]
RPVVSTLTEGLSPMPRILVVDDDDGVRTLIRDILSAAKHEVDTAATVRAARPLVESNYFNLLIADLMLPDGSGIQVAEEAQRRGTPTIILTAYAHRFRKADLARFGLMMKPVRPDELLEAVEKALKG